MEQTFTKILIRICHISEMLKNLSTELDKLYEGLTSPEIVDIFKEREE